MVRPTLRRLVDAINPAAPLRQMFEDHGTVPRPFLPLLVRFATRLAVLAAVAWACAVGVVLLLARWLTPTVTGTFGDSFGTVNTLIQALSMVAVSVTLALQTRELELQRREAKSRADADEETRRLIQEQTQSVNSQAQAIAKQTESIQRQAGTVERQHRLAMEAPLRRLVSDAIGELDALRHEFLSIPQSVSVVVGTYYADLARSLEPGPESYTCMEIDPAIIARATASLSASLGRWMAVLRRLNAFHWIGGQVTPDSVRNNLDNSIRNDLGQTMNHMSTAWAEMLSDLEARYRRLIRLEASLTPDDDQYQATAKAVDNSILGLVGEARTAPRFEY